MDFDEINRLPVTTLIKSLNYLVKKLNDDNSLAIHTEFYDQYNRFIIESYSQKRANRYSISQLADFFNQNIINKENIEYLITRYIDGMYLLAELDNKKQEFVP